MRAPALAYTPQGYNSNSLSKLSNLIVVTGKLIQSQGKKKVYEELHLRTILSGLPTSINLISGS
jgi:hypothetical protein